MSKFDLPSARNISTKTAVSQFVPTELFWDVLHSDGNDVIFGTRGSGKTLLLRMMAVNHLVEFATKNEAARDALFGKKRFGVFIPLGLDWCVAYQDGTDATTRLFADGVNLVGIEALVEALSTMFASRVLGSVTDGLERSLCGELAALLFRKSEERILSFLGLKALLLRQQSLLIDLWRNNRQPTEAEERDTGYSFRAAPLFLPLSQAVTVANRAFGLGDEHKWLLCLDELEDLKPAQMKAVATFLRSASRNLVLKLTTQPYTFRGAETHYPDGVSAVDFRDFNVRRLQFDPHQPTFRALAAEILRKRMNRPHDANADRLPFAVFGTGTFADRAQEVDSAFARQRSAVMLRPNSDSARKVVPVLAIRALKRSAEGNRRSAAYSGWNTIVALSDGNPGIFIRLLNDLKVGPTTDVIPATEQHRVVSELAATWHEWSQALYKNGKVLYELVDRLGRELQGRLHARRPQEDEIQEEVNRFRLSLVELSDDEAEALRIGARHALFVAEAIGSSMRYPETDGVWRLSYGLAPKYWLLPRRGRIAKFGPQQLPFDFGAPRHSGLIDELIEVPTPTSDVSDSEYV